MIHKTTKEFWEGFFELPSEIRTQAEKSFELLKNNPFHPSLHFKKVGKFWTARVDKNYRAIATQRENGFVWLWIGSHDNYEELLKR